MEKKIINLGHDFGLQLPDGIGFDDIEFVSIRFKNKPQIGLCELEGNLIYLKPQ